MLRADGIVPADCMDVGLGFTGEACVPVVVALCNGRHGPRPERELSS